MSNAHREINTNQYKKVIDSALFLFSLLNGLGIRVVGEVVKLHFINSLRLAMYRHFCTLPPSFVLTESVIIANYPHVKRPVRYLPGRKFQCPEEILSLVRKVS